MNTAKFAEEFAQLLHRWMKPISNEDGTSLPLLTNQEIISSLQNVQQKILGVNLQIPDYSSVKTPATGIAVCTPSAPIIPKPSMDSMNTSLGRYRSLDTLMSEDKDVTPKICDLGSKNHEKMHIDECIENEAIAEEKKFMSQSNPAIYVNKIARSDTFIREQEKAKADAEQAASDTFTKFESPIIDLPWIMSKISALRECATNILLQTDDMNKDVYPQSTKPIRRLSSIGGFPGASRSSMLIRPISSSKMRRSSSGIPGTPTSSKLNTTLKVEKSTRRSMAVTSTKRSPNSTPKKLSPSVANVFLKKSPCTTKNSKYAHVQSTIPKPTTMKRKAQ